MLKYTFWRLLLVFTVPLEQRQYPDPLLEYCR